MNSTLDAVIGLLKDTLPVLDWMVRQVNQNAGSLGLSKQIIDILTQDDSSGWAYIYECPEKMKGLLGSLLLGEQRMLALAQENISLNAHALASKKDRLTEEIYELISKGKLGINDDTADLEPENFMARVYTNPEYRTQFVSNFMTYLPHVFQYFSMMTHGFSMSELVQRAKEGSDRAFCMAIQIDRTVLSDIPYFRKRLVEVQLGGEAELKIKIADAMKGRILGHKIRHRKLWLVFAILEDHRMLNMPLVELLEICMELDVHGGISAPNTLGKRRNDYLSKKGRLDEV